jgi:hypothetical protein
MKKSVIFLIILVKHSKFGPVLKSGLIEGRDFVIVSAQVAYTHPNLDSEPKSMEIPSSMV